MTQEQHLKEIVFQLRKTLPAQAPLKDFIATNTLYAFQDLPFYRGLREAHRKLGVKTFSTLREYRKLFRSGKIKKSVLEWCVSNQKSEELRTLIFEESLAELKPEPKPRLRALWKKKYELDLVTHVQPIFFRHLGHFLDQGISFAPVPFSHLGFWGALQEIERTSLVSLFSGGKKSRAHRLLFEDPWKALHDALEVLIGSEALVETYLFEMVQEHPGWSGLVSVVEGNPGHLNFPRNITLHEALAFEILLELDYVDKTQKGKDWRALSFHESELVSILHSQSEPGRNEHPILEVFHSSWEWTYYRELFTGLKANKTRSHVASIESQVFFCIDDRCCSLRRHLEEINPSIQTFGTPGFFGVEFWYQGEFDRFPVKLCPAPVNPGFLIRGTHSKGLKKNRDAEALLTRLSHTLFGGWLISQTFGLLSAVRMIFNIFSPSLSPKVETSFRHTDDRIQFKMFRHSDNETEQGLRLGYSRSEMADRVFGLLRSCGLVQNFSDLVVMVGHGSSTVNNPHYAAYDCGACSGRPGSINARIFCSMANDPEVRALVREKGLLIPEATVFIPALYDTTRDQLSFYDVSGIEKNHQKKQEKLRKNLEEALLRAAKERARRFDDIPLDVIPSQARKILRKKSVSIFEPRQEFTHSGNAACIVGPRSLTRGLFLDRRCFLNSYDPSIDPEGEILCNILRAAVPVCGGINLQYFFSRIDNEKLGSGTKLPHNVVGLIAVANGTEGDLRPGLPKQMIEWHEPIRLMMFVYQEPAIALQAVKKIPATYEWIKNEWVKFSCMSPTSGDFYVFESEEMKPFDFFGTPPAQVPSSMDLITRSRDFLPITLIGDPK